MSQLGNSPGQLTRVQLEARKSFSLGLWFLDTDGRVLDITGCSVRLVVKAQPLDPTDTTDSDNLVVNSTASLVEPLDGYCVFDLQASELDLGVDEYPFVIVLTNADGYSSVVVKGSIDVLENPEFSSMSETYPASSQAPQSLAVVMRESYAIKVYLGPVVPPGFNWFSNADKLKLDSIITAATVVPSGGEPGQVLGKKSLDDYDFSWVTLQAFDGTLDATGIAAGKAPVSDGADSWNWGDVSPTVDWSLASGAPGSILNKPTLGTAAAQNVEAFSAPGHTHDAAAIVSGIISNSRVPAVFGLRGISAGTEDPSGGVDGDIYFKIVE